MMKNARTLTLLSCLENEAEPDCLPESPLAKAVGLKFEHQGIAPCIPVWKTGVYLSTLMLA